MHLLVIQLDSMQGLVVKVEAHEVYGEQVGEACEFQPFVSITQRITFWAFVFIVPCQKFWLHEGPQGFLLFGGGNWEKHINTNKVWVWIVQPIHG